MTFAKRPPTPLQVFIAVALLAGLAGCGEAPRQEARPAPTVTVAKPVQRAIVDQDEYVGRFVAVESVELRARVSGYLDEVHFNDGQLVKQGDPLFTIDKRSFQNAVAQARANLDLARSNLTFAESDIARGRQLVRDRTITEQVFDQRNQTFRNAQASVAANEAALRQAELDLEFTEIHSPIDGRISRALVTQGILISGGVSGAGATLLTTIVSLDRIRYKPLFETTSEDLLSILRTGTVSTNHYLRRLHNLALGLGWLPWPV